MNNLIFGSVSDVFETLTDSGAFGNVSDGDLDEDWLIIGD